jgi:hypothetical protein
MGDRSSPVLSSGPRTGANTAEQSVLAKFPAPIARRIITSCPCLLHLRLAARSSTDAEEAMIT